MKSKEINCINNLIADIDCLEPLNKWTKEINIFNILKINRMEIRHSNMLAWLLSPNETHGLNDKFLKKLSLPKLAPPSKVLTRCPSTAVILLEK